MGTKNNPVKCHSCGTVFTSNFCPDCGMKYEDVKKQELPILIETYVHGNKEDGYELCSEYGIDDKSKLGQDLVYCNYEVKLVYRIEGDKLLLHQVDAGACALHRSMLLPDYLNDAPRHSGRRSRGRCPTHARSS